MDEMDMAAAIAHELNEPPWEAEYAGLDEVNFTNEDGEKFVLTVRKVEKFS